MFFSRDRITRRINSCLRNLGTGRCTEKTACFTPDIMSCSSSCKRGQKLSIDRG
ncbi:hypothetical protein V6Z12_D06G153600 [Gossypium hirsutum]